MSVISFPVIEGHNTPTPAVLDGAREADLKGCIVCGWTKDGELYAASSYANLGTTVLLIERMKQLVLDSDDE